MTISTEFDRAISLNVLNAERSISDHPAPVHRPPLAWIRAVILESFAKQIALIDRCWWQAKAYGTILGVVLLAAGSLLVLFLHQWIRHRMGTRFS